MRLTKSFLFTAVFGLAISSVTGCVQSRRCCRPQVRSCNCAHHANQAANTVVHTDSRTTRDSVANQEDQADYGHQVFSGHISDDELTEPRTARVYRNLDDDVPNLVAPILGPR